MVANSPLHHIPQIIRQKILFQVENHAGDSSVCVYWSILHSCLSWYCSAVCHYGVYFEHRSWRVVYAHHADLQHQEQGVDQSASTGFQDSTAQHWLPLVLVLMDSHVPCSNAACGCRGGSSAELFLRFSQQECVWMDYCWALCGRKSGQRSSRSVHILWLAS